MTLRSHSHRTLLVVSVAAGALLIAGCGDDGSDGEAGDTTEPTEATTTTSKDSVTSTTEEGPVPVCELVNPETLSNIVGEQLTPQPEATGGCGYSSESASGRNLRISVLESGGDEGARTTAEQRLGAEAEDLTVEGAEAWLVSGDDPTSPEVEAGATAKDAFISLTMSASGDPAADRDLAAQVITHVVDALG